jgi:hypothetical protein
MDQPNMCKCPGTATYPTLHAGEQWISRVAPIETRESLPMKLHNVEARTPRSSAYQLLPESGYWSSQTQRAGDLLTCFELFQRHLTNLPRFYKVVQEDCRFLLICPAARCLNDDHKTKMNIHMHIKKLINIYM